MLCKIIIRKYRPSDCKILANLFYNTVHTINAKDYTKEQLDVWAPKHINLKEWNYSFLRNYSIVAVYNDTIAGFGDIDKTGFLNRLFTGKDFQRQGIASAICGKLEQRADGTITTHASITAKAFFEKRGYRVVKAQEITRQNTTLTNFIMQKQKSL